MKRPEIDVVSGLCVRNGKMLMQLRKAGKRRGGMWEHPGGKVEPGEPYANALIREWREELGVGISIDSMLHYSKIHVEAVLHMRLFAVRLDEGQEPQMLDADAIEWVDPMEAIMFRACTPETYLYHDAVMLWMGQRS